MFWFRLNAQKQEENRNGQSQSNCFSLSHYGNIANIEFYAVSFFFFAYLFDRTHSFARSLACSFNEWVLLCLNDGQRSTQKWREKKAYKNLHTVIMHVPLTQRADNVSFHTYYTTFKFVYFALLSRASVLCLYTHANERTYAHIQIMYFENELQHFGNLPKRNQKM